MPPVEKSVYSLRTNRAIFLDLFLRLFKLLSHNTTTTKHSPKPIVIRPPGPYKIESIEYFTYLYFWMPRQFGPTRFVHDL